MSGSILEGRWEELGGKEGIEILIKIYYLRKKSIFNKIYFIIIKLLAIHAFSLLSH